MEAWNQAWTTEEGREEWLVPESFVAEHLQTLRDAGVKRVLDLGFGVGRHAIQLAKAGFTVYGIDASPNGRAFAEEWAAREGLSLQLTTGDMATLPYEDNYFDAILTWNVIYHGTADYIHKTIAEIERCLVPQGYLICSFISTQNYQCGRGEEIEPHTYVIPGGGEKEFPHHYFDQEDVESYLSNFDLLRYEDVPTPGKQDYHWHVFAQMR